MGSKSLMFSVELPTMLHLCFMACGPAVVDVAMDICACIDVVTKVTREGLIDLPVAIATLTSLEAWRAAVVA